MALYEVSENAFGIVFDFVTCPCGETIKWYKINIQMCFTLFILLDFGSNKAGHSICQFDMIAKSVMCL